MKRIAAIAKKELLHIRNDSLSIKLMIVPVLLQLFVLGYALTTIVKHTPVAWCDLSDTPQSRSLCDGLRFTELFNVHAPSATMAELQRRIDDGELQVAFRIPADFARRLGTGGTPEVDVLVDGQDASASMVATSYLTAIVRQWGKEYMVRRRPPQGGEAQLRIRESLLFNPLLESSWYMVPPLAVLLVTMVTAILSGLSIVKERTEGTLEQLMVTPLAPSELVFGKTIPYLFIGFVELTIFLLLSVAWFRIPFLGSAGAFFLFGFVYMLSSLGIGMFASTIARTPQQVLFIIWFFLIFFLLLSGFFIPVENMPLPVQHLTLLNPVRYFIFAIRLIFLKGAGLAELWRELLATAAIGIMVFGGSLLMFNRRVS